MSPAVASIWGSLPSTAAQLLRRKYSLGVSAVYSRMIPLYGENRFYRHVASHWIEMQQAMIAMIIGGVFEFHPKLRVGFLEAQNSWVPGLLSRIEWDYP